MKLKFVEDEVVNSITKGKRSTMMTEVIEELYKHPNKWVEYPEKVPSATLAGYVKRRYNEVEARVTGGNNLAKDHPDKKFWTLYLRYIPAEEETF